MHAVLLRYVFGLLASLLLVGGMMAQTPVTLPESEPVTVTLSAEGPVLLTFEGVAGDVIQLSARPADADDETLDPVLELLAPDGRSLIYADDRAPDDRAAQTPPLVLAETGVYTVRVNSFNGVSAGDVIVRRDPADRFTAEIRSSGDETTRETLIQASLPRSAVYRYEFQVQAGDQLTLTARDTSGTLDPLLHLRDADGVLLTDNDDHGTRTLTLDRLDARISAFSVSADGLLTVEVRDFLGRAGTFDLVIVSRSQ